MLEHPKTTPMSGDLLEGLSIKLINNPLAKVYYSDVGRLHSWIIKGKDTSRIYVLSLPGGLTQHSLPSK